VRAAFNEVAKMLKLMAKTGVKLVATVAGRADRTLTPPR